MRDVSTTGGYVPFSIYKYMKKKHVSYFYKNLYWGTQSENIQQCVKDGRHQSCKLDM